MQYEIEIGLGATDQVGLRFRCETESQAEKIHLSLRTENLKVSRLMPSKHTDYTHFIYVSETESHLRNTMPKVVKMCGIDNNAEIVTEQFQAKPKTDQTFKAWQIKFIRAVKQLNSDSLRPIGSIQEVNSHDIDQKIELGRASEVEEQLLGQTNHDDSNALRSLIALYAQTDRQEQVIELWKYKRSKILALPVSGRLVEQLVQAHIQYFQQTNTTEALCFAQQIAQEFLPELERLRQANGVRELLHQALKPQELPPTIIGETLNEQLVKLLEIEPGEQISQLESLRNKYPKAGNVLLALAESYTAVGNSEAAFKIYRSISEKTEAIQSQYLTLLLDRGCFQDVLLELPQSIDRLSPILSGLRGIALYYLGEKSNSRQFLEKACNESQRNVKVLLLLARLWTEERKPVQAGRAYQTLQELGDRLFTLEDYVLMAQVANSGGFGDLSNEQKEGYFKKCAIQSMSYLLNCDALIKSFKNPRFCFSLKDIHPITTIYSAWLD